MGSIANRTSMSVGHFMLFWDYDTQWGADRSRSPGGAKGWGMKEFENTDRLLALQGRYQIKSCFAVVGAAALPGTRPYHDPHQIRAIHAAGNEVGSHSFQHDWLPGLGPGPLKETLMRSKEAIEECIGAKVISFVPPWNQPVDHLRALSISLTERRLAKKQRTDVARLCRSLAECGYRFSRISYRSAARRVAEWVLRRRLEFPTKPKVIEGIKTIKVNIPCGFDGRAETMVRRCAERGGFAVAYGHPHSLSSDGPQQEEHLEQLLSVVADLRDSGQLRVVLPMDLLG